MKKTALTLLLTSFFTISTLANASVDEVAKPVTKSAKKSVKKTAKRHTPSGTVVNGIRYVSYDKDKTYTIPTAPGIVSEIIFEDGESVEYHRFGFGDAWVSEVTAGGNILVFRSKTSQPETNLLVHTDKRDYVILLVEGNTNWTKNPNNARATYSTRFKYFDDGSDMFSGSPDAIRDFRFYDYDYRRTDNAEEITPTQIYDDGVLTYIKFKDGTPRGTIYRLDKKKKPYLLNSHTDKFGKTVIHGIYPHLIIRLDEEAVEIRRNSTKGIRENRRKTTLFGTRRTVEPKASAKGKSTQNSVSDSLNATPTNAETNDNDQALLQAQQEYQQALQGLEE